MLAAPTATYCRIKRLATHRADAAIVAVRFQEDQGLAEGPATERGKVLVKAARDAGLVANDRFDAAAIEDTIEVVGEPSAPAAPAAKLSASEIAAIVRELRGSGPGSTPAS